MSDALTREAFREAVFARDNHTCVFCASPAIDAHHIIERRLWGSSGGYYIDNGASVCAADHIECERTTLSVEDARFAAGITKIIVPPHLYPDQSYDKWGNPVLANGSRLRGDLFYDPSVQKILAEGRVLDLFTHYVKYPRTHHMPWSGNINDDDRVIHDMDRFIGRRVVVTEKVDGESTTMYSDYIHARSVDGRTHPSRSWVKQFHSTIAQDIPPGWRVCGENLYATHSIHYTNLPTYFMGFNMWDDSNVCISWDETMYWFELLGITPVPVLYDGIYDEFTIRKICSRGNWETTEGVVMRVADSFSYRDFQTDVAKFVRQGHVQTQKHWMHGQPIVPNKLQK